jgi:hypothetical protein
MRGYAVLKSYYAATWRSASARPTSRASRPISRSSPASSRYAASSAFLTRPSDPVGCSPAHPGNGAAPVRGCRQRCADLADRGCGIGSIQPPGTTEHGTRFGRTAIWRSGAPPMFFLTAVIRSSGRSNRYTTRSARVYRWTRTGRDPASFPTIETKSRPAGCSTKSRYVITTGRSATTPSPTSACCRPSPAISRWPRGSANASSALSGTGWHSGLTGSCAATGLPFCTLHAGVRPADLAPPVARHPHPSDHQPNGSGGPSDRRSGSAAQRPRAGGQQTSRCPKVGAPAADA